ncbi:MAG TPA: acyl-CoA dehydrogenase family protein [Microthrixaceae bacterium]|nr:acyl-CoA dehydrogenase family protein [Microthrixaceae bacterium]HQF93713.1 acyl-CoA dehydrogenase family protein [Microthrixaceae bacterium]
MDLEMPSEDDPRRIEVRAWIADHPSPTGRELAEAGLVAPHWPRPWGLDADPIHQLIIDDELKRARIRRPDNMIGIGWAGPTLVHAGTPEQKDRYLFPLLAGEEIWCQLFSEPDAGSDLASLGTRAVRDGDEWVVNGSKIWNSGAQNSQFGILIARTDPDAPKHQGISYFVCPMDTPGVEVRPVREMTGVALFNEVFFTDVRLPADAIVGDVNRGWGLAKVTLGNERVSLSGGGALWGMGPDAYALFDIVRERGGVTDPVRRQELASLYIEAEILRLIRLRTVSAAIKGEAPGPEASIRKLLADEHGQKIMGLAKDLVGTGAMLTGEGPMGAPVDMWHFGYLFARALTIGGGTTQVQRNILAERVLGLPHDIDPHEGRPWTESRR